MDESKTYVNVKFGQTDAQSPSNAEPEVSYVELNLRTISVPRFRTGGVGLTSTYAELNFSKDDTLIAESEDHRNASRPGEQPITAQIAADEQQSKMKIGNRPHRLICLLCLVTAALIVIVTGLSIHVSQIHQSKVTSDRDYHELKSTLQSMLSALNCNRSTLRNQFTEMETKYRSVNETKAQICEFLTSRREQTFSQEWIRNEDGCYFISTFKYYYKEAKEYCLSTDSKLLEINSAEEEIFISKAVHDQGISYWIGKCKDGEVASNALGRINGGDFEC
ncbi:oxidized low-density lipoprotein receptor 1-like, partial [Hypanus sabinus]|uniref:oxidized low-density lipoprotein receptor 1-like n=1 Tax=Hypanus sabinus TaxID=79690 RepID=UPI0028C3F9BD